MKIFADLHLHSKYSRACSKDLNLENLTQSAKLKGLKLLITGDFTHPVWFKEISQKLQEAGDGVYKLKGESDVYFLLGGEISSIFSRKGVVKKIHYVVILPRFDLAEKLNKKLSLYANLAADGRPILGLDVIDFMKILFEIYDKAIFIPAHIWTPHFSLYGSMSGFNSIHDAFNDYVNYVSAVETGLSCYDEETEVLTDNGWKKFSEVKKTDKICTLNIETNKIKFQHPTGIYVYQYNGKMYRLKTKRVDLLVTPNHKLLVSGCDFRKPPRFYLKEAEFLFGKSKRFKKDGIWVGESPEYFVLPAVKMKWGSKYVSGGYRIKPAKKLPIKPWLKFFGFWLAEGWTTEGKDGDYNVCLSNKNIKLLLEMKEILESFGYKVVWNKKLNTIRVRDYQLFHYLKQFGKCHEKFIPKEIKALSKELLEIFFEYYIKGDGHIYGRNKKGLSATTTSVRLRDDLQEIALKIGISAYYKLRNKKGTIFKSPSQNYQKVYRQRNDSWTIYFVRKNIHTVMPSTNKKYNRIELWINYEGKVFCVSVPNKVIYVRRNGIPVWCGNSDPNMNWRIPELDNISIVSFSDAHSTYPHRLGREATLFELENLSYQNLYQALKMPNEKNKILMTIEFFPEEGKYHYDGHRFCKIRFSPEESKQNNFLCPVCGKKVTIGVMSRVEELAQRPKDFFDPQRSPFKRTTPLSEILAQIYQTQPTTKKVFEKYLEIVKKFGPELEILTENYDQEKMKIEEPLIFKALEKVNSEDLILEPGYDGEYGKVIINLESVSEKEKRLF